MTRAPAAALLAVALLAPAADGQPSPFSTVAPGEALPPGWSTRFVRMVIVESGNARAGRRVAAHHDVEPDFRAAFGHRFARGLPSISGVTLGNDTDRTGESVTARFGDARFEARR
ncbi:MAG TPA: DUF3047 domain-containing protein [Usitatibacter sp.]|nr:DUF3047 domain-containing protein [Usitatibacter sp.]